LICHIVRGFALDIFGRDGRVEVVEVEPRTVLLRNNSHT